MDQKRTTATREPIVEKRPLVRPLHIQCPLCKLWFHQSEPHTCTRENVYIKF